MNFDKLYRPAALNSFQVVAVVGLLMAAGAHVVLRFGVGRVPTGFSWLYACWSAFYVFGTLRNYFGKPEPPHHHHHEEDDHEHDPDEIFFRD